MRKTLMTLAAGAAIVAVPAVAQVGLGGSANLNAGAALDPAATVGSVTDRVGQTVDSVDGAANDAVDSAKLTLATREQVRAGAQVTDAKGASIGTVQGIDGDNAIVVDGGKLYNVPLSALYSQADYRSRRKAPCRIPPTNWPTHFPMMPRRSTGSRKATRISRRWRSATMSSTAPSTAPRARSSRCPTNMPRN